MEMLKRSNINTWTWVRKTPSPPARKPEISTVSGFFRAQKRTCADHFQTYKIAHIGAEKTHNPQTQRDSKLVLSCIEHICIDEIGVCLISSKSTYSNLPESRSNLQNNIHLNKYFFCNNSQKRRHT